MCRFHQEKNEADIQYLVVMLYHIDFVYAIGTTLVGVETKVVVWTCALHSFRLTRAGLRLCGRVSGM